MKIVLGSDHGGFELKEKLREWLKDQGHAVVDVGTKDASACDYPDYARQVGQGVASGSAERGIMICGSGVGASIAANKIPGVRAALCHDTFSARQGVEDDDANCLCLGARVIGYELALDVLRAWLSARFSGAERHLRRLNKVLSIEKEFSARP